MASRVWNQDDESQTDDLPYGGFLGLVLQEQSLDGTGTWCNSIGICDTISAEAKTQRNSVEQPSISDDKPRKI